MDKLREKVPSRGTADCPFQRYQMSRKDPNAPFANIHWHPEAEILYMKQGAVEVRAGKHVFPLLPGQIAFIPPGELHAIRALQADSGYDAFVFSLDLLTLPQSHFFQRELISPLHDGKLRFPYLLLPDDTQYGVVSQALDRVCQTSRENAGYKRTVFTSMVTVFAAMMDATLPGTSDALQKNNDNVKTCLQYMEANFSQRLSLQSIADQVHLHPNYLCALFKDYTGQTVFQHLIRIRIEKAAQLLRTQDISVSDAATACGFDSTGFFAKKFKSIMGVTPKEYSLRHR